MTTPNDRYYCHPEPEATQGWVEIVDRLVYGKVAIVSSGYAREMVHYLNAGAKAHEAERG